MRILLVVLVSMCAFAGCGENGAQEHVVRKPDATPAADGPPATRERRPMIGTTTKPAKPISRLEAEKALSGKPATDPCALVSRAEARKIVGRDVHAPSLAPQGPTCIYGAGTESVTLAVQTLDVRSATKAGKSVIKLRVGRRSAYCVDQGGLKLMVPLSAGRTLTVGAACPVAAQFAAKALTRIGE